MAKLTSLDDLKSLLSEEDQRAAEAARKKVETGYGGRPQKLEVRLDSKRRRGKTVTLITGFESNPDRLEEIAGMLKKSCGAGGTVQDNSIEIQGDHCGKVIERLKTLGFEIREKK
ncbi:MAG: translation initiation factor [Candidatus Kapaibacterium sp.]